MNGRFSLLVLVLAALISPSPHAQIRNQDLTIQLGGVELRLGMQQEDVLRKLAAAYNVNYSEGSRRWDVMARTGRRPIGQVSFRMERLFFVSKEWFEIDAETATAHALAIRNAISAVAGQGSGCAVSAEPEREPPATLAARGVPADAQTVIKCGRRRVVMISSKDPSVVPQVFEIVE